MTELHRHVIMERASGMNREVWMDMEQVKQAAQRRHLFWTLFLGMGAAGGAVRACIGNWMCSREAHGGGKRRTGGLKVLRVCATLNISRQSTGFAGKMPPAAAFFRRNS